MVEPRGKQLYYCYLGPYYRPGLWKCHLVSEPFAGQSVLNKVLPVPIMLYTSTFDFCLCSVCHNCQIFYYPFGLFPRSPMSRVLSVLFCTNLLVPGSWAGLTTQLLNKRIDKNGLAPPVTSEGQMFWLWSFFSKRFYLGDPWVAQWFCACLWPRAPSWSSRIKSCPGMGPASPSACVSASLSPYVYHK